MITVRLGRGAISVRYPPRHLLTELRRFVRGDDGGKYEDMYSGVPGVGAPTILTMPGYAARIMKACPGATVVDARPPLPKPDVDAAVGGMPAAWHEAVLEALRREGGTVRIPAVMGGAAFAAALVRAMPREELALRGTPLTLICASGEDRARRVHAEVSALVPGREVGLMTGLSCTDSDDVIVADLKAAKFVPSGAIGVLVCLDVDSPPSAVLSALVSSVRNAARWGVFESALGGPSDMDMVSEGLFGPLAGSATYADAVRSGIATDVRVCWIPAPRPRQWGSAPFDICEALAQQENPQFRRLVGDIMSRTPDELGCVLYSERRALILDVAKELGIPMLHRRLRKYKTTKEGIVSGGIRKLAIELKALEQDAANVLHPSLSVAIAASCRETVSDKVIPWRRASRPGERTYLVDFLHDWDVHNGCRGILARNDAARSQAYKRMGFAQATYVDADHLPFL